MKRNLTSFIIGVLLLINLLQYRQIFAQSDDDRKTELEKKIAEYTQKLNELRKQKDTLASQIQYFDTQIFLTGLRIQDTEEKIYRTEEEIETLSSRISSLDSSLDHLSKLLISSLVNDYKQRNISLLDVVLDSKNANNLIDQLKYFEAAKNTKQKVFERAIEAKVNFEQQKDIREKKKKELDQLQIVLKNQQSELDRQKTQKQKLLTDTQNDETTYQKLLQQAQQQLNSFKSFVQSSGANSTIAANAFGQGADGNYFSQRDVRWAANTIGYSSENILSVGCLLTSIAMFGKKLGQDVTPADIAADPSRFWGNTAWMKYPWPGIAGKTYTSVNDIDSELAAGNYVIVGVRIYDCSYGGNHYVVLTKKDGNDYIMHDPIYGPDIKFSSHYSTICSQATFK